MVPIFKVIAGNDQESGQWSKDSECLKILSVPR